MEAETKAASQAPICIGTWPIYFAPDPENIVWGITEDKFKSDQDGDFFPLCILKDNMPEPKKRIEFSQ